MALGLLGGGFDYSAVALDEFNDWYDTEHIPERLRIKGFINAVVDVKVPAGSATAAAHLGGRLLLTFRFNQITEQTSVPIERLSFDRHHEDGLGRWCWGGLRLRWR